MYAHVPITDVHDALTRARHVLAASPHLDDAVLSTGATLASCSSHGALVTVLTLFAGCPTGSLSPVAVRHHRRCRLPADAHLAITLRRAEDEHAVVTLGATPVHAEHLDVVYRRGPGGQWVCRSDDDLFRPAQYDEQLRRDTRATIVGAVRRTGADLLLAPAAVGCHVDHVMVRELAIDVGRATRTKVLLWKDQPYSGVRSLPNFVASEVDPSSLETKVKAASHYASQLPMLWPHGNWREALASVAEEFLPVSID